MIYRVIGITFLLIQLCIGAPIEMPKKRFPTAIIVGVKKAGTRALLEFLRLNPHVKAPGPEVHFFDKNFHKGLEWYREQMPLTTSDDVTIEKSPAYFHSKNAPERIKALNPNTKIIIVVRDPITRAISDYTQASSKRKRLGLMPSFEDMAVGDCAVWLKANCSSKVRGVNAGWGAIRIGVYHKHMKRWLEHFPFENIHLVDGEQLIKSPAHEVSATERFLGLKPTVKPSNFGVDPVKKFPCVRRSDGELHCLGKTKGRPHPDVRPEVLEMLKDFYVPENQKFFQMINRRFFWDS
ncbi:unnamed protein product [Caenorhabditis auriculariae]|uniref:Sulfotransferase domain-containing protein n=1 Tax=Caenorhabditis auriculariae TaxID=2777116 RepID=A0A8S1HMI0_9PELO|nr:unnamed protein product [Caenorhabditis auriculariae]